MNKFQSFEIAYSSAQEKLKFQEKRGVDFIHQFFRFPPASATQKTAKEIERNFQGLPKAEKRLKDSGRPRRVLQVPQNLMTAVAEEMRKRGVPGTVKNLSETKRISVQKKN